MQAPVTVLTQNTKRETGKKAQLGNIAAAKVIKSQRPRTRRIKKNFELRLLLKGHGSLWFSDFLIVPYIC